MKTIIGVIVGGVIAIAGQLLIQRSTEKAAARASYRTLQASTIIDLQDTIIQAIHVHGGVALGDPDIIKGKAASLLSRLDNRDLANEVGEALIEYLDSDPGSPVDRLAQAAAALGKDFRTYWTGEAMR